MMNTNISNFEIRSKFFLMLPFTWKKYLNLPCCGRKRFPGTWVLCRCHGNTCCVCWVVGGLIICYSITLCCIFRSQWWIPTATPTQTLIPWRVRGATGNQHQVSIGTVVSHPFQQKIHHINNFKCRGPGDAWKTKKTVYISDLPWSGGELT